MQGKAALNLTELSLGLHNSRFQFMCLQAGQQLAFLRLCAKFHHYFSNIRLYFCCEGTLFYRFNSAGHTDWNGKINLAHRGCLHFNRGHGGWFFFSGVG